MKIAGSIIIFISGCFFTAAGGQCSLPGDSIDIEFIRGADLSSLPKIEEAGAVYYNFSGKPEDPLVTLSNHGMNAIRLRIWKNPADRHCGFKEVSSFAEKIHRTGLAVWLCVHYSKWWADPSRQVPPENWQGISSEALADSVYYYTSKLVSVINPEFIQIGNEINNGLLLPEGKIKDNENRFLGLLTAGTRAVRDNSTDSEIIIHYAGISGSGRFFERIRNIDYDIIGLSYYPVWHGKDLKELRRTLLYLSEKYRKDLVIAETAYPFTLGWNDMTHNIVGMNSQLILPEFPATPRGQAGFIARIIDIIASVPGGRGFCYWGGEMVAFEGPKSRNGSHWENQALYDFDNKALPLVKSFRIELK